MVRCRRFAYRNAFTLVEIMIVIVIIGLLAAMAIPLISAFGNRSKEKVIYQNLRQLNNAAQIHFLETAENTADLEDLVGPGRYLNRLDPVAGETYPSTIAFGVTEIVATGASFGDVVYIVP